MKKDNELIAEFMEVSKCSDPNHASDRCYYYGDSYITSSSMKYHASWDWLMPVVEKISLHVYDTQEDNDQGNIRVIQHRAYMRTFGMITDEGKWMVRINRMP